MVGQYTQELASTTSNEPLPSQLLLNVDGVAESEKTFTLLKTWARIQELEGQNPSSLPSLLLSKFGEYTGPDFPGCPQGIVPVFPLLRQFEFKGMTCSRTQFPLRLAYAIAVHKS